MIRIRKPVTVTVQRPAARVRGGDLAGPPAPHEVSGCAFWPDEPNEDTNNRDTTTVTGTLVTPRSADVGALDKVVIPGYGGGKPFDVVGEPQWNHESALSGNDFGLKWYQVKGVF